MAIAYLISKRLKGEGGGHMLPPRLHQANDPRDHDRAIVVRRFWGYSPERTHGYLIVKIVETEHAILCRDLVRSADERQTDCAHPVDQLWSWTFVG